jgi:hypothetical protein
VSGLVFGFVVGGVALVAAVIWAIVDNLFIYRRKADEAASDDDQTKPPGAP